jgi:hypothetical protein
VTLDLHTQILTIIGTVIVVAFLLLWLPSLVTHFRLKRRARRRIGWYS